MFSIEESIQKNFRLRTLLASLALAAMGLALFHLFPELNTDLQYPPWFPAALAASGLLAFFIPMLIVKLLGPAHRISHSGYFFNIAYSFIGIPSLLVMFSHSYLNFIWIGSSISFMIIRMYHQKKRWMRVMSLLQPVIAYAGHVLYWNIIGREPFRPEALLMTACVTFLYFYSVYFFIEIRRENRLSALSHKEKKRFYATYDLTPREEQIVEELISGYSTSEIASRFPISAETIKTHTKNIYRKMGVNSRVKIIAKFLDHDPDA